MIRKKRLSDEVIKQILKEIETSGPDLDTLLGPTDQSKIVKESSKTPCEKLLSYKIFIEESVFWESRQAYLKMLQKFLQKKIDAATFTSEYFQLRAEHIITAEKLCAKIEDQILPLDDLYYTSKAAEFTSAIADLYFEIDQCNSYIEDSDWNNIVYSESQLRSIIQENFVPIFQKSCDLNDSFFQLDIDYNKIIQKSYFIFLFCSLGLLTSLIAF